jgi:hypothetical protein
MSQNADKSIAIAKAAFGLESEVCDLQILTVIARDIADEALAVVGAVPTEAQATNVVFMAGLVAKHAQKLREAYYAALRAGE